MDHRAKASRPLYGKLCSYGTHTGDKEAEWQSYWGSLSFEYSQFFPRQRTALIRKKLQTLLFKHQTLPSFNLFLPQIPN
jgi:hypothetical protein